MTLGRAHFKLEKNLGAKVLSTFRVYLSLLHKHTNTHTHTGALNHGREKLHHGSPTGSLIQHYLFLRKVARARLETSEHDTHDPSETRPRSELHHAPAAHQPRPVGEIEVVC